MKSVIAIPLLVSAASAILSRGPCPTVNSIAYNSKMRTPISHYLLYTDTSIYQYLGILQTLESLASTRLVALNLPSQVCYNLGDFGYSLPMYEFEFSSDKLYSLQELFFDPTTGT